MRRCPTVRQREWLRDPIAALDKMGKLLGIPGSPSMPGSSNSPEGPSGVLLDGRGAVTIYIPANGRDPDLALPEPPVVLGLASRGTIHSETLRAFTEDEYRKIIASLP